MQAPPEDPSQLLARFSSSGQWQLSGYAAQVPPLHRQARLLSLAEQMFTDFGTPARKLHLTAMFMLRLYFQGCSKDLFTIIVRRAANGQLSFLVAISYGAFFVQLFQIYTEIYIKAFVRWEKCLKIMACFASGDKVFRDEQFSHNQGLFSGCRLILLNEIPSLVFSKPHPPIL